MFIWLLANHLMGVFASPTPGRNINGRLSRRSVPLISNPSDWNPTQLIQITDGFRDACTLAKAGRDAAASDNQVFRKYFPADQAHNVLAVFNNIIGSDTSPGGSEQNPNPCADVLSDITIFRDFPDKDGLTSCDQPYYLAATRNGEEKDQEAGLLPQMIICDTGLKHGGINKAYDDGYDPQGPGAVNCQSIGNRVTYRMDTLGATILHEYTHYFEVTVPPLSNYPTRDDNFLDPSPEPEDIYGPLKTREFNNDDNAVLFADIYAWFATEAFWTAECNTGFDDPQTGDGDDPVCDDTTCSDNTPQPPIESPPSGTDPDPTTPCDDDSCIVTDTAAPAARFARH